MITISSHPVSRAALPVFTAFLGLIVCAAPYAAKPVIQLSAGVLGILSLVCLRFFCRPSAHRPEFYTLIRHIILPFLPIAVGALLLVLLSPLWGIGPSPVPEVFIRLFFVLALGGSIIVFCSLWPGIRISHFHVLGLALLIGILGIQFIHQTDFAFFRWWRDAARIEGHVTNKGAMILTLLLPAIIAPILYGPSRVWRGCAVAILALMLVTLTATQGQASLLALLVALLAALMPVHRQPLFRVLALVLVSGILLTPFIALSLFAHTAYWMEGFPILRSASAPERLEVWNAIATEVLNRPWLGHGYDSTRYITAFDTQQIFQPGVQFSHPHNLALQFWMEFGLVGALWGAACTVLIIRSIQTVTDLRVRRLYFTTFAATFSVALIGWGAWQIWWIALVFLVIGTNILAGRVLRELPRAA